MEVELGGFLIQNSTYDYDEDYEYKEDSESGGSEVVLMPLLYSLVLVVGLLGHMLLLTILALKRKSWSTSDTFILHLGLTDILLLLTLPFKAAQATQLYEWYSADAFCKISGAVLHINFYYGIFLLACISVDRCLSVVYSTQLYFFQKHVIAHVTCLCVWLVSLLITIPDWVFLTAEKASQEKTLCVHNYSQSGTNWQLLSRARHHLLGFLLPTTVLIICWSRILLRLQQRSKNLQKQSAVMFILPLVAVFFLCWMPYNITLIVDTFSSKNGSLTTALMVTSAVGCVHACLRPLLYLGLCGNFRKQALTLLRCTTYESKGSLWELSVGKGAPPEQSHMREELKQMTSVEHQLQPY